MKEEDEICGEKRFTLYREQKKIKTIIKKSSENKIFSIFTVEKLRNKEGRTGKRERAEREREGEQDR